MGFQPRRDTVAFLHPATSRHPHPPKLQKITHTPVLLDAFVDFIIYALQLLIQPADMSFDALLEDGRLDPGEAVLLRRLHIDQLTPPYNKGLEFQGRLIWHCSN